MSRQASICAPAFFLLETVVYLFILSFLLVIMLHMSIVSIEQLAQSREKLTRTASIHALMQRFLSDVQAASSDKVNWTIVERDKLIWKRGEHSIGWMFERGTVVRKQGVYDAAKNVWRKKTKSTAAKHIKSLLFELEQKEERVKAIHACITIELLKGKSKKFESTAYVYNGALA